MLSIIAALFVCTPFFFSAQQDSLAQYVSKSISITGKVAQPLTLTLAGFGGFKLHPIENIPIISYSGDRKETIRTCKGVLLRDVLDKAGIVFEEKRDFNRLLITATATDGFRALWSWHEIYNSETGNHVFIIIEKDGKSLSAREGDFMLLSTTDTKTGPRHVRWLKSIEIIKL